MNLPNREKTPVSEAEEKDLKYWGKRIDDDLNAGKTPQQYVTKNKQLLDAIKGELLVRRGKSQENDAKQAKAIENISTMSLVRNNDPGAVTEYLQKLSSAFHLVSPSTRVDAIPEGCGIAVTYVTVNPDTSKDGPKEVYAVGDRLGLSMDTLKRIAAGAALDWDVNCSGRLDDGSNPHYVHYRAVGHVRNFDGTVRTVTGEVEIDAREGSPQIEEIRAKAVVREVARRKKEPSYVGDGGDSQVLELRKFILRHAESKAKNRAIADIGVKRSYAQDELKKPFAIARIMWTGQTADDDLRRVFAEKTADAMIGGMSTLYGRKQDRVESAPRFVGHSPPPVGHTITAPQSASGEPFDWEDDPPSDPKPTVERAATTSKAADISNGVGDGYDYRGNDPDKF
jgi:hypothetical protein